MQSFLTTTTKKMDTQQCPSTSLSFMLDRKGNTNKKSNTKEYANRERSKTILHQQIEAAKNAKREIQVDLERYQARASRDLLQIEKRLKRSEMTLTQIERGESCCPF